MEERPLYRVYSQWLRERYGSKVLQAFLSTCRSPAQTAMAQLERAAVFYCGAKGGGNETLSDTLSVAEQVAKKPGLHRKTLQG